MDAIHSGELAKAEYEKYEVFNLDVPTKCKDVPDELLNPKKSWSGNVDFSEEVNKLAELFVDNFKSYQDEASQEVVDAGPKVDESKLPKDDKKDKDGK